MSEQKSARKPRTRRLEQIVVEESLRSDAKSVRQWLQISCERDNLTTTDKALKYIEALKKEGDFRVIKLVLPAVVVRKTTTFSVEPVELRDPTTPKPPALAIAT